MGKIKVISFDVEGTLATPDFSQAVWHEGIPSLYARRNRISFEEAKAQVEAEYQKIGDHRLEWYDISYWFKSFHLGDYRELLENCKQRVAYYSDTLPTLASLTGPWTLVVTSASTREFLPYLLHGIGGHFARVFSSISDCNELKVSSFYLWICREMGVLPEDIVHIGDSWEFDFVIPRQVGINAFHLDRMHKTDSQSLTDLGQFKQRLYSW